MLKLSIENETFDIPDLNKFKLGDLVICDATADFDRFEGIVVGIELQRLYGSNHLQPSITLLENGSLTDGFKPSDLRRVDPAPPQTNTIAAAEQKERHDLANLIKTRLINVHPDDQDLELEDEDWGRICAALTEGQVNG